jgi:hypothetical protein
LPGRKYSVGIYTFKCFDDVILCPLEGVKMCPAACEKATEADKNAFKELTLILEFI